MWRTNAGKIEIGFEELLPVLPFLKKNFWQANKALRKGERKSSAYPVPLESACCESLN
jgi:hypothetical protein